MNLPGQYLVGTQNGGVETSLCFEFCVTLDEQTMGRRVLMIDLETEGKITENHNQELDLVSKIQLLKRPCGRGHTIGEVKTTKCGNGNAKVEICDRVLGWVVYLNQCEDTLVVAEEEAASDPWFYGSIAVAVLFAVGILSIMYGSLRKS